MGGLGNQMFQYAFARKLSIEYKTDLLLDTTFLEDKSFKENFTYRDFELDKFNVHVNIAQTIDLIKFKENRLKKIIHFLFSFTPFKPKYQYLREPHFYFFKKALRVSINTYLDGYWQSEKYFLSIRDKLLVDFWPKDNVSDKTKEVALKIKSCNAISLHVRQGDYVSNAHNNSYHGTCSVEYYNDAIKLMGNHFPDATFYIFSDEPDWFNENITTTFPIEYVTHNRGKDSYQDIYLMSLCKHNIIANSSFSWWGAWLNTYKDKIVIAPKKWFKNDSKDSSDLIPETWIRL